MTSRKKVSTREFALVAISIISVLTISFTLLSSDHIYMIPIGMFSWYEIPQRFLFALFGFVIGALIAIAMAALLVIEGKL